ncbi:DUF4136 domain-containing protein [Alteromonas sp. H39]|uniref:DUF4136 domain-containing protein n=1 Tax=Alteromonas sp. H39 TaxID=3389876 RepID=UPI0039E118B0
MPILQKRNYAPRLFILSLFALLLLAGCASSKPQVKMLDDYNFTSVESFYVRPPLNSVNQVVEEHIAVAITDVLTQKGLKPVPKDDADVEVGFFPSTALKEDGKSVSIGLGTGVFGRSSGISLGSVFNIPVGEQATQYQNLQIDIIENGTFIYSAAGSAELESHDSITIQTALTKLVDDLLAAYPGSVPDTAD